PPGVRGGPGAALVGVERLAVFPRDDEGRLTVAEARGLAGPHVEVAERLLDLSLGPFRARGMLVIDDAALHLRLPPGAGGPAPPRPGARRARPPRRGCALGAPRSPARRG